MHVKLPYGEEYVPVDVPDNWINGRCYRSRRLPRAADERAELLAAMESPEGGVRLEAVAQGRKSCTVAIDATIPSLFRELLPAFLEELEDRTHLGAEQIRIVVANRAWRPYQESDLPLLLGPEILGRHPVQLHQSLKEGGSVNVGMSKRGFPLHINRWYMEADLKILFGPVVPDLMSGFTGGRAILMPGLAGERTLRALHDPAIVSHPCVRYGLFRDNPFHIVALEALDKAPCDFAVSALLCDTHHLSTVIVGDVNQAHLKAAARLKELMEVTVKEPMDIVVTSCAGLPHDNAIPGLVNTLSAVEPVLKRDGTVVVTAKLPNGFGADELERLLRATDGPEEYLAMISRQGFYQPGQWIAQRLYDFLREHEVILYTDGLPEDVIWSIGLTPASDMQEAIHGAMESHGQRCKIAALPDGPLSLAILPPVPLTVLT